MQMAATRSAAWTEVPDHGGCDAGGTEGSDVGGGVGDWDASSGTGSGGACGGCEAVEDPKGLFKSIKFTSLRMKRIWIECAFNPLWNISHYKDAMRIEQ